MSLLRQLFGHLQDGRPVHSILLKHDASGFAVEVLEYGAILRAIHVPAKHGRVLNTILAYDTLAAYESDQVYLGALIGRCANRIANGTLQVDRQQFQLSRNQTPHHLHGGTKGFSKQLWRTVEHHDDLPSVMLEYDSPDGDEGYPGNVSVTVTYTITAPGCLTVLMRATTDRVTPVNLTLHPYFNLSGNPNSSIDDHELCIAADSILQTSRDGIPTGQILSVTNTPFDFRTATRIHVGLAQNHPQLSIRGGYDHHWILNKTTPTDVTLSSPTSGIQLQLSTNQSGIQFYSAHLLQSGTGAFFRDRAGLCIEPQGCPNAVNEPRFPSVLLHPQESYVHTIRYSYSQQPFLA